ncbi:glycoside hydrolase family 5 protein [Piedraia hortae CBS 480.64]|uniref:Glycoside hydrolase family 5 protein n=1 Tax=Piedraia hortae CBS 480.64 TaxID=1314780 RepID=A0A6A7BUJ1_9PEZI|nr:glycoside hydrolase family 5 protein [Piedraia hortae CBS 480.64]
MASFRLKIDGKHFKDTQGRQVTLHGINVSGDSKLPAHPDIPSHESENFFDGDNVSFVDRPFSLKDSHIHFARLKRWGFNTLRYIFTWEALEHEGPGKYDEAFITHTVEVLRIAKGYGFYVFMDPHQDVWSRFTGGSGAPMWTLYACGLDPTKFQITQSALVQNTWEKPAEFPKMAWATNYWRLACGTVMTLFFGGRIFAPKCAIDGKNIQDYLQSHFLNACKHLARRIHEAGDLHGQVVCGYETINEPNCGFLGNFDISQLPKNQNLKKYTCPTVWQAILTGSGRACEIDTYDFGSFGPYKNGKQLVDPKGVTTWLDPSTWDDFKYGWKRSEEWKLGQDIWALHGVWDPETDTLLQPHYFSTHPKTGEALDHEYFTNNQFMDLSRSYRDAIRSVWPQAMLLVQPSPFEVPPNIKNTADDESNLIFASHFYDGITLITKKWNRIWNIDVLGILRGRYSSPAFAIKLGETAIRNCLKDQLSRLREEGEEFMGNHPCVFSEIGIPFDMDDNYAYKTGDYSSQVAAIDANSYAVEGSMVAGMMWWNYTAGNSHFWGDNWNGEDLSIYCEDDHGPTRSLSPDSNKSSEFSSSTMEMLPFSERSRGTEASIRPYPVATHGDISSYGFDLRKTTFTLTLTAKSSTPTEYPTEVFLPEYHFHDVATAGADGSTTVEVSGGKYEVEGQTLKWWHGEGEQKLVVKGGKEWGSASSTWGDDGLLEVYLHLGRNCTVM